MVAHNIVGSLPLTDQTDPRKFPGYEFREYPKMMLRPATQKDIEAWRLENVVIDDRTQAKSYRPGQPKIGQLIPILGADGHPATVADEDEEEEFRRRHPEVVDGSKVGPDAERERLAARNAELERELAEMRAGVKPSDDGNGGNGNGGASDGGKGAGSGGVSDDGSISDASGGAASSASPPQSASGVKLPGSLAGSLAHLTAKTGQRTSPKGELPTRLPPGGAPAG